jgi:hypothetical protein
MCTLVLQSYQKYNFLSSQHNKFSEAEAKSKSKVYGGHLDVKLFI